MLIYVGKINYSPYASDELFSVVFRDNIQVGDRVAVIHQWSKENGGQAKANSAQHGTVSQVSHKDPSKKEIEFFANEKERTYYWFKGQVWGDKMTLSMWNKGGEEVTKKIELQVAFF
ncbi:hypothetical protein N7486_003363 [Penicillium sp. IBT 16267x]|nr:hypothetical protein N7486_003363 [Penicillium sp. IBT 16267x]